MPSPWREPCARIGLARICAGGEVTRIASTVEAVQDGRIHIEKVNGPFLYREGGTPAEYKAGLDLAIARGWLELHESGTLREIHAGGRRAVRVGSRFRTAGRGLLPKPPCRTT